MGETIDDALASRRTVVISLESFEGKRRTGTITQKAFEPRSVPGWDANGGIDAEPSGGLPGEHIVSDVALEQSVAVKVTEHPLPNGLLKLVPVGGRELGGLMEPDRPLGIVAEHAVDDTDMETEVSVR